jgi:hypothetical protein
MSTTSTREEFLESLETDASVYFDGGRQNNFLDMGLTVAATLSSLIAASVAATNAERWIRVGVAAIPAAFTSTQKIVEVKARSNWYFSYAARLRALATTLEYDADPNLEDYAAKRAAIDLDVELDWGKTGRGGAKALEKGKRKSPRS